MNDVSLGFIFLDALLINNFVLSVFLGIFEHFLDLRFIESRFCFDADFLLLARLEIFSRDMEDPVCIDIKGHFNLGHAARRWWDIGQIEPADLFIVFCHFALAL